MKSIHRQRVAPQQQSVHSFTSKTWLSALVIGLAVASSAIPVSAAEAAKIIAPPAADNIKAKAPLDKAVFAGGCFWGIQGMFEHVRGVRKVVSGYSGGDQATANYEVVSSGKTGHAEAVEITFDPAEVSYGELLHMFFSVAHDPTQLNRQTPDTGPQYRSAIFTTNDSQKTIAQSYIAQLNKAHTFPQDIVTVVSPFKAFYAAEDYHQDFLIKNPNYPYIVRFDLPKIENLKKTFPKNYQEKPSALSRATS
jgi:peptide-methionine (S)-S-oxide reductase